MKNHKDVHGDPSAACQAGIMQEWGGHFIFFSHLPLVARTLPCPLVTPLKNEFHGRRAESFLECHVAKPGWDVTSRGS